MLRFINFLEIRPNILLQIFFHPKLEHALVRHINFLLEIGLFLANDLELLDEDTEQDGIDDCVDHVDDDHHAHLCVGASVHFDQHESNGGIVPHRQVLVVEKLYYVIWLVLYA